MSNESDNRRGRHRVFNLRVQLVFVAKYRRRVFDAQAIDVPRGIFADVCSDGQATLAPVAVQETEWSRGGVAREC